MGSWQEHPAPIQACNILAYNILQSRNKKLTNVKRLENKLPKQGIYIGLVATLKCSNSSRKTHGSKPKLILNVDQDIVIVSVANIVYIYTEFGVTRVYLNDGHWAAANVSLLQLYASLDPNMFFRANRQTIVNVEYIARIAYIRSREFRIHLHPPFDDVDIFSNLQKK